MPGQQRVDFHRNRLPNYEHLARAPITEAVLEVQVRARSDLTLSALAAVRDELSAEYPHMDERRRFVAALQFSGREQPAPLGRDLGVDGYIFWSQDRLDAAQFRVDGFAINRLKPYPGWSTLFPRFQRLWNLYCRIAEPVAAVRIAVRCINQFPVIAGDTLDMYLAAPPQIPDALPEELKGYLMRMELAEGGDPAHHLNIVQGLQIGPDGSPQLLLDIDAFDTGDIPPGSVLERFDDLHDLRNRTFFDSLTPDALKGFR